MHFQDGSKLTPDDVVFSIARITNPAFHSPQLSQFDQIASAEVSGPAQVTLHTKAPYPVLLAQLVKLSIVPKAYVQKVGDQTFNQQPIGSGPYKLHAWQRGVQSVLDADPSYWRGKPPFRTVTFRVVPDEATRVADLRAGRADIIRQLTPDDAAGAEIRRGSCRCSRRPPSALGYLFVNAQWRPGEGPARAAGDRDGDRPQRDHLGAAAGLREARSTIMLTPANFGYIRRHQAVAVRPNARPRAGQGGRRRGRHAHVPDLARL